jgi:hypothetical protein
MKCLCCGRAIEPRSAWRGGSGRFYCSGFCAESEEAAAGTTSGPSKASGSATTRKEAA